MTVTADKIEDEKKPLSLTPREEAIARGLSEEEIEAAGKGEDTAENASTDAENGGDKEVPQNTEATQAAPEATSWITPEIEYHATSYGLTKDRLAKFKDEESYRLTTSILDESLIAAGKQGSDPAPSAPAKPATTEPAKHERFDLEKLKAEGYDEQTLALYKRSNELVERLEKQDEALKTQATYFERIEQEREAAAYGQHINEIHAAIDTFGDDLYGKVFKDGKLAGITEAQVANRKKLYDTAETIVAGMYARAQAAGKQPEIPPTPILLKRAQDYAFADELRTRADKKRAAEIAEQSKQRRPAAGRPLKAAPQAKETDPVKSIAEDPRIAEFWRKAQEKNGSA